MRVAVLSIQKSFGEKQIKKSQTDCPKTKQAQSPDALVLKLSL